VPGAPGLAVARFTDEGIPPITYVGRLVDSPQVWREVWGPVAYWRLRRRPLEPDGLPLGDGRPVLLVPGFMGGDDSLRPMRDWLVRLGYGAELPGLVFNIRYSEAVVRHLVSRLVDLYAWHGRGVTVVGHSRGGMLAKVMSHRHPQMVEQVVALGSPLADPYDVHPLTMAGVRMAQAFNLLVFGRTARVEREFLRDLEAPALVPLTSIYSRGDGIVYWRACLRPDATCIEVESSHVGFGASPDVFALLARLLAPRPDGRPRGSA
jgi:triacylglycerol lipase